MIQKKYTERQLREAIKYWTSQFHDDQKPSQQFKMNQLAGRMLAALVKRLDAGNRETVDEYLKALKSYGEYEDFRIACEDMEELFYAVLDKIGDNGIDPITMNDAMRGVSYSIDYDGTYHLKGSSKQIRTANNIITMFFANEWFKMTDEEKNRTCVSADLDRAQMEKIMTPAYLSHIKIGRIPLVIPGKPESDRAARKITAWPQFAGRPAAITRQKQLLVDRMLIVLARLAGIEKAAADELAVIYRREDPMCRYKSKDLRIKLFDAVFSAYGVKTEYSGYPLDGTLKIKNAYHFDLAVLFAGEWKKRRAEMEKLCREINLDGDVAASLAG